MNDVVDTSEFVARSVRERDALIDGRPALREMIAESSDNIRTEAEIARKFAELGDDTGLMYAVRKMTAYLRNVIETTAELQKANIAADALEKKAR